MQSHRKLAYAARTLGLTDYHVLHIHKIYTEAASDHKQSES